MREGGKPLPLAFQYFVFMVLTNQPPLAAYVGPSGVGGVEASWKNDFFPAVMYLLSNNLQKTLIVKGQFAEDYDD